MTVNQLFASVVVWIVFVSITAIYARHLKRNPLLFILPSFIVPIGIIVMPLILALLGKKNNI